METASPGHWDDQVFPSGVHERIGHLLKRLVQHRGVREQDVVLAPERTQPKLNVCVVKSRIDAEGRYYGAVEAWTLEVFE
jgi:hypothetical protein